MSILAHDIPELWRILRRYLCVADVPMVRLVNIAAAIGMHGPEMIRGPFRFFVPNTRSPANAWAITHLLKPSARAARIRVWGQDKQAANGRLGKKYILCSERTMYALTRFTDPSLRNFYEIINEAAEFPGEGPDLELSRLYVDAEFELAHNSHLVPGDFANITKGMIKSFREAVVRELPDVTLKRLAVLESSDTAKFSNHLVAQIEHKDKPGMEAFICNPYQAGAFMRRWEFYERTHDDHPELKVYAKPHKGKEHEPPRLGFLGDAGVYNFHRQFRPLGHVKLNSTRFLSLNGRINVSYEAWMGCLIQQHTRNHAGTPRITVLEADGTIPESRVFLYGTAADASRKRKLNVIPGTQTLTDQLAPLAKQPRDDTVAIASRGCVRTLADMCTDWAERRTNDGGCIARNGRPESLLVSCPRTRMCRLKGAEHNGNKIFFIFNVHNKTILQGCGDEVCMARFSSQEPIPAPEALFTVMLRSQLWCASIKEAASNSVTVDPDDVRHHEAQKEIQEMLSWSVWNVPLDAADLPPKQVDLLRDTLILSELETWLFPERAPDPGPLNMSV